MALNIFFLTLHNVILHEIPKIFAPFEIKFQSLNSLCCLNLDEIQEFKSPAVVDYNSKN